MEERHKIVFGYQGAFDLTKEEEEKFIKEFPHCEFIFKAPGELSNEECEQAEVMIGQFNDREMKLAKNLKWLQASTVGVDRYKGLVDPEKILVTNSKDLFNKCMGEHAFGMMIAWSRALLVQRDSQMKCEWVLHDVPNDLFGNTIVVVGLGGIGSDLAKKAKAFDMHVIGIRRNINDKPDYIDEIYTMDHFGELLGIADYVALAVPLTDETYHLMNKETFKKMKSTAYLLNMARGECVDTDDLIEALRNKTIAAAGLDVVDPEPLPSENPLWKMENVFITPHRANASPTTNRFRFKFYFENMQRYFDGRELLKLVKRI